MYFEALTINLYTGKKQKRPKGGAGGDRTSLQLLVDSIDDGAELFFFCWSPK